MANSQAVKLTETWARAASVTSSHERDYFVEALREMQREKEAKQRTGMQVKRPTAEE
jgi:hypothetical protein